MPQAYHNSVPGFFTASGISFGFADGQFRRDHVTLDDIAHHLGQIVRFGGAGEFYTVLQHSLLAAELVDARLRRQAVLHDAAEAYIGDAVSPLKSAVAELRSLEQRFITVIFEALDVPWPTLADWRAIHTADRRAMRAESYRLGPPGLWEHLGAVRDEAAEDALERILAASSLENRTAFVRAAAPDAATA